MTHHRVHSEKSITPKSPEGDFKEFIDFQRVSASWRIRGKEVENQ